MSKTANKPRTKQSKLDVFIRLMAQGAMWQVAEHAANYPHGTAKHLLELPDVQARIARLKAAPNPVDHPDHYTSHPSGVECIAIAEHMNFNLGNVVKYVWRNEGKNGLEDLRKAAWYLNREIARREAH